MTPLDAAASRSIVRDALRTGRGARLVAGIAFGLNGGSVFAQASDLVDHNGFEQCWSKALAKDAFLTLLAATVEGTDACIPAAVDGSSCATSMCTDGSPGCAVTLRAGQYSYAQILPANGQMLVNASTGFDPFSMPVVLPVVGACTINFLDTTNVAVQSPLSYSLQPDGNSGYYANDLLIGASTVVGLSSDKLSLSGSFSCQIANLSLGFYTATLGDLLTQTFPAAYAPTIGASLCPLP